MSAPLFTMPNKGLILGVYEDESKEKPFFLSKASEAFDEKCNGKLSNNLKLFGKSFKKGKSQLLFGLDEEFPLVSVVHVGKKGQGFNELEELDEGRENVRAAIAKGALQLRDADQTVVFVDPCDDAIASAEGCHLSVHKYDELKPVDKRKPSMELSCYVEHLNSAERTKVKADWELGTIYAEAQNFARLLMEMPSNILTPTKFTEMVNEKLSGLCQVTVRDQTWVESQKMGAFLSVSRGSREPLCFLELSYENGGGESLPPIALVGKGITFDSGGISLKPSADMDKMRADMGGAACVVGTIFGVTKLQLPINLKAFIPLCENMPSGSATKPGDVVTAMNGKTIQVDNTDAEGRLILADALCYASSFNPQFILDMATLTGAMGVALGSAAAGTFTNSSACWNLLQKAGRQTGDRLWRMPLFQHFTSQVTFSQLAALNNIGKYSRAGGSCTAAAFLREFVGENQWIHIDIAGVMMNKDEVPYLGGGMAGRPTRTVIEFLKLFSMQKEKS
ncbi:LAP3 [Acanthosepion pharaonis]|uniref:Cytosol aminopeptidase n=1 Tax=Acanthosepion pharaonis TaxID=158019 RepID=A0A812BSU6_ACAPH|nr:LAP3 [Sepia pharaonis]